MTEGEVIERVHAAQRELARLFEFINAGEIVPQNGCLSYTFSAARLRANDAQTALTNLLTAGMQHAKERAAAMSASQ